MRFLIGVFATVITLVGSDAFAVRKPVNGVRDYNGTYSGATESGTIDYVTLFRDNYGTNESGCEGEGCGSHAGVDIPIPSNTPVYAARDGFVVGEGCDWNLVRGTNAKGFGGYTVVRAQDPQAGTIYLVYAHLSTRYYSAVGTPFVTEGTVLGLSGGGSSDPCPGSAQGPHLHFQIDKYASNPLQAYGSTPLPFNPRTLSKPGIAQANCVYNPDAEIPDPDCRTPNTPDGDFRVMEYTYNPMPLVTAGYNWNFEGNHSNTLYNKEFWQAVNFQTNGASSGRFWMDPAATDPWLWRNPDYRTQSDRRDSTSPTGYSLNDAAGGIAAEASIYNYLVIDVDNTTCISNPGKVYFITNWSPTWSEDKVRTFNYAGPTTYYVYMAGTNWSGYVKGIRIDPAQGCTSGWDPTYIHQIRLMR